MFGVSVISGEARGEPKGEAWGEASGESRGEVVEAHDLGVVLLLFVGLSGVRNVDSVAGGGHELGLQKDGGGGNEAGYTVLPRLSNIL